VGAKIARAKSPRRPLIKRGDGTTTATLLAAEIVKEGVKGIAAGMNPKDLKLRPSRGLAPQIAINAGETAPSWSARSSGKPRIGFRQYSRECSAFGGNTEGGDKCS
jgi:hypothetical protein